MNTGADRPDKNSPQEPFFSIQPINESAGEQHGYGIDERKDSGYIAIILVCPMKFGLYPVRPSQRKDLSIKVVNVWGKEKKGTNAPSVFARYGSIDHHVYKLVLN